MSQLETLCYALDDCVRPMPGLATNLHQQALALRRHAAQIEQAARQVERGPNVGRVVRDLYEAAAAMDAAGRALIQAADQSRSFVSRTVGAGSARGGVASDRAGVEPSGLLPGVLRDVFDHASFRTPNGDGRFFLAPGDHFRAVAYSMPPAPAGTFLAMVHGSPDSASVGNIDLSPHDLALLIRADQTYAPGQAVTLFSCSTGAHQGGFAQQLADELGVDVLAPTSLAWLPPDGPGAPLVTPMGPDRRPLRQADGSGYGRWVWFNPSRTVGGV